MFSNTRNFNFVPNSFLNFKKFRIYQRLIRYIIENPKIIQLVTKLKV